MTELSALARKHALDSEQIFYQVSPHTYMHTHTYIHIYIHTYIHIYLLLLHVPESR
jgi:hypothetical protein